MGSVVGGGGGEEKTLTGPGCGESSGAKRERDGSAPDPALAAAFVAGAAPPESPPALLHKGLFPTRRVFPEEGDGVSTNRIAHGGGGRTGSRRTRSSRELSRGSGRHFGRRRGGRANESCASPRLPTGPLPWQKHQCGVAVAGAFGRTPPRDASSDGLWVAECRGP